MHIFKADKYFPCKKTWDWTIFLSLSLLRRMLSKMSEYDCYELYN